jgi:hypothetical protein
MMARMRLLGDHVIAGVKRCHMVHEVFQKITVQCEELVMDIACGLHNFRAMSR